MRRLASVVLAGGLLAGAALGAARADEKSGGDKGRPGNEGDWRRRPMDLTDDQKDKLADIRQAVEEAVMPLELKQRRLLRTLRSQLRKQVSDKELVVTLDALKAVHGAIREERWKGLEKGWSVFTPLQQAHMALMMARPGGMRGGAGTRGGPDEAHPAMGAEERREGPRWSPPEDGGVDDGLSGMDEDDDGGPGNEQ